MGVVVIGGGASGVLAALHLIADPDREVTVVESAPTVGHGLAYGTRDHAHLLNSRAETMSVDAGQPGHFVEWCRRHGLYCGPVGYAPRATYGRYLSETFEAARRASGGRLRVVRGRAVAVEPAPVGYTINFDVGEPLTADQVILALGHPPANNPRDAWAPGAIDAITPDDHVLLLGTGLTAVDVLVTLAGRGHRGPVTAISRHGLFPRAHVDPCPKLVPAVVSPGQPLRDLVRAVRVAARGAADWRGVVDGIRPVVGDVWAGLSPAEQDRFLRHVSRLWEIHRHRMAPPIAAHVRAAQRSGRLRVLAGRVTGTSPTHVVWAGQRVDADHVLDCRGQAPWVAHPDRLARQLADAGLTRPDVHRLGYDTTPEGRLVGAHGVPVPGLWTLGPTRRGSRYETTAVPEIREQAALLAKMLPRAARQPALSAH